MGMFDNLYYRGQKYQTRDTPAQFLDDYKIEQSLDDGHWWLWHEEYDAEWQEDGGLFGGHFKKLNQRWVCCDDFDGLIRFYRPALENEQQSWKQNAWIEYKALFMDGRMIKFQEVHNEPTTKLSDVEVK